VFIVSDGWDHLPDNDIMFQCQALLFDNSSIVDAISDGLTDITCPNCLTLRLQECSSSA
jgi:hypothetical protein